MARSSALGKKKPQRLEKAPANSPLSTVKLPPFLVGFDGDAFKTRSPATKPMRDIVNLWRYARAVLRVLPDGRVQVHENQPENIRLYVIAVLNSQDQLCMEIAYYRQQPYGKQSVGPKAGPRLCISNRRPTASLTEKELEAALPVLAATIQKMADEKIGNWQRSDFSLYGHTRPSTGRKGRNPGTKINNVTFERGALIRVPANSPEVVAAFRDQYFAKNAGLHKTLKFVAWFVERIIAHYKLWKNQSQKLAEFFNNDPNYQWLEPRYLAIVLASLSHNTRKYFEYHLEEMGVERDDIDEAKALMGHAYVTRLGAMSVRIRPQAKQPKHGRHVVFEILASQPHCSYVCDEPDEYLEDAVEVPF